MGWSRANSLRSWKHLPFTWLDGATLSGADLRFDQFDIVQVLQGGKYLTGEPATWGEGDWNGAPGGWPGNPPLGDGRFDQLDLIAALSDCYLTGPYAATKANGLRDDQRTNSFADAVQAGQSGPLVPNELAVIGSSASGELGDADLIHVPEPSGLLLAATCIAGLLAFCWRLSVDATKASATRTHWIRRLSIRRYSP